MCTPAKRAYKRGLEIGVRNTLAKGKIGGEEKDSRPGIFFHLFLGRYIAQEKRRIQRRHRARPESSEVPPRTRG